MKLQNIKGSTKNIILLKSLLQSIIYNLLFNILHKNNYNLALDLFELAIFIKFML